MDNIKITIIEPCNFIDTPTGGNLIFVKNLIKAFGNNLKLIGTTTNKLQKIGEWSYLEIDGIKFDYFAVMRCVKGGKKGILPERLRMYLNLLRYKKRILKNCDQIVYIGTPEVMAVFYKDINLKILYFFHGLTNPLSISKYNWAKYLSHFFDLWILPKISFAHKIFAAGDFKSIEDLEIRSSGKIQKNRVLQFPTRVDENIFKKIPLINCRIIHNLNINIKIVLSCGRLSYFKGWELMLDSFKIFLNEYPDSIFLFIGEGEDELKIIKYIEKQNLRYHVKLLGYKPNNLIAQYLCASDLFVMGSFFEGWSTTLVEAASCGVPSVVTNFSSARDIIINDLNGYVIDDRDPMNFFIHMKKALDIDRANLPLNDTKRFWVSKLKEDLISNI